jgi:hypothetical protein
MQPDFKGAHYLVLQSAFVPQDFNWLNHSLPPQSLIEPVRDLWTLNGVQGVCTASIWRNDFGLELRVENNGERVESRLSRVGEAPLLLIADEMKTNLIAQGWTEAPNAT